MKISILLLLLAAMQPTARAEGAASRLPQSGPEKTARERAYGILPAAERDEVTLSLFYILERLEEHLSRFPAEDQDQIRDAIRDARDGLSYPEYVRVLRQDWYKEPIRIFAMLERILAHYCPSVDGGTFLVRTDFMDSYFSDETAVETALVGQFTAFRLDPPDYQTRFDGERRFHAPLDFRDKPAIDPSHPSPSARQAYERWMAAARTRGGVKSFAALYRRPHPEDKDAYRTLTPSTDEEALAGLDEARVWQVDAYPNILQRASAYSFRYGGYSYFSVPEERGSAKAKYFKIPLPVLIRRKAGLYSVPEHGDDLILVKVGGFFGYEQIWEIVENPSIGARVAQELVDSAKYRSLPSLPSRAKIDGVLSGHTEITREAFMRALTHENDIEWMKTKPVTVGGVPSEWFFPIP